MLKYTPATLVLNTAVQSEGLSADQRVEESSEADSEDGTPLGLDIPALVTKGGKQRVRFDFFVVSAKGERRSGGG